jgi:hypothetical protein
MVKAQEGVLRLPAQSFELGGVLAERADRFLAERPGAEASLRRVLTLRLANVREDGEPTRRRAAREEFSNEEWRLVSDLANYPNRLLVTVVAKGETFAEVAHEAIFRRWDKLRKWIDAEREFLAWRSGLEAARRAWLATPEASKIDALLSGLPLAQARHWLTSRRTDLYSAEREFIEYSLQREALQLPKMIGVLSVAVGSSLLAVVTLGVAVHSGWSSFPPYISLIFFISLAGSAVGIYFNSRVAACFALGLTGCCFLISVAALVVASADPRNWVFFLIVSLIVLLVLGVLFGVYATFAFSKLQRSAVSQHQRS